jgi:hypothetical protein
MIIWGSKAKEKPVSTGHFFCPRCYRDGPYTHVRVAKYFTLYFIPLVETQTLGEYVRCDSCGGGHPTSILDYSREALMEAMRPWSCPACGNRNSAGQTICVAWGAQRSLQAP